MTPVSSSTINSIGFNRSKNALIVKFRNGGLYVYQNVEQIVYTQFLNAPSKGQFLDQSIKGDYQFLKIDDSELNVWLEPQRTAKPAPRNRNSKFSGLMGAAAFI